MASSWTLSMAEVNRDREAEAEEEEQEGKAEQDIEEGKTLHGETQTLREASKPRTKTSP